MRRLRDAALLAVGLSLVVLLCLHFGVEELQLALHRLRPEYLAVYLCLAAAVFLAYSLRWYFVARAVGKAPPLRRLIEARLAGDAVGFLVPGGRVGGDPIRIALVYGDGTQASVAGASVAADRLVELTGNIVCAVAYVTVFSLGASGAAVRGATALVTTLMLLLMALMVPLALLHIGFRPLAWLYASGATTQTSAGWRGFLYQTEGHVQTLLRDHPCLLVSGVIGSVLIELLIVIEYATLMAAFGVHLGLPTLLLALVGTGLARSVPTPASIGGLEGSQVAALTLAGESAELGFVVGMILRMHETLWLAVGLAALVARGFSLGRLRLLAAPERRRA